MIAGQLFIDGLAMGLVFVILATGMVLLASVNKILFMAYGMFYTLGAYFTWWGVDQLGLPYFPSLIIGVIGSSLLGMICYLLVFDRIQKLQGGFLATLIASLGLNMLLARGNILLFGTEQRGIPSMFHGALEFAGITMKIDKLVLIIVGVGVVLILFWIYEKTAIGRSMRAVAFAPEVAALHGINIHTVFLIVMGLSTAMAGVAGAILAPTYGMNANMGANVLWTVMLMAMLGGMDSLLGAVVGGLVIGQLLSFGQFYIGGTVQVYVFVIIGIVLYFRPNGLLGRGISIET